MRVLDLFCGAGGAGMGYRLAWPDAEIVGVDIVRQWEYPFEFVQGDALSYPLDGFDFVHASPPCKAHTVANRVSRARAQSSMFEVHPDLVGVTLDRLRAWGGPFVLENVPGAPVPDPVILCGSMFGLRVRRHRLFACSFPVEAPKCAHHLQPEVVGVYGLGGAWTRTAPGGGGRKVVGAEAADALGITHTTTQAGLSQAIPPAYTRFLAERFDAWRSSQPDAPAAQPSTEGTSAHRCEGAAALPHTSRTAASLAEPSPACQVGVGGEFGQLQLGAGELPGQSPFVPSLGMGGGSAGDIGAVLELSGVHKEIQPQTPEPVNHKLGGAA